MRLPDEPKGWRRLQTMAQNEEDPARVAAIIDEMNQLLDAHERLSGSREVAFCAAEE